MNTYTQAFGADVFPRAGDYTRRLAPAPGAVREDGAPGRAFPYSERHLRCVWFDPAYRPAPLRTQDGQTVIVEDPGRWNLEAGPDFLDAALRFEPGQRHVRGDVEIHVRPAEWGQHGHAGDPRYRRVVAHVTYYPATVPAEGLPQGAAEIALRDRLAANPAFSFESIDLTAYPYAAAATPPPCAARLTRWSPEERAALLEAAGEERLRRKAERLAQAIKEKGSDQVLYEEIMAALGYKNNRVPFRVLAASVPLELLRREAGGDVIKGYALLCGVAGLLPAKPLAGWDQETRGWVRRLWDIWWKLESRWQPVALTRTSWALAGLRPQNHPLRRLMAAADLFGAEGKLAALLAGMRAEAPEAWYRELVGRLQALGAGGYWWHRYSWSGARRASPVALIGAGRAAAILTNVIIPWQAASQAAAFTPDVLASLAPEEENSLIRQTAFALFGHDHNPALYRTGLRQQGLLQIFHDFCLNARSGCRDCSLVQALATPRA